LSTRYTFTDDSDDVRLSGFLDPEPTFNGGTITGALNVATTDLDSVPLVIELPAGFGDGSAYQSFVIKDSDGNALFECQYDGTILGTALAGSGSAAGIGLTGDSAGVAQVGNVSLTPGSSGGDAAVDLQPPTGHIAKLIVRNSATTAVHVLESAKAGFFGQTAAAQPLAIANAAGGAIIDAEARAALNSLLAAVRTLGLIAT
jgi:hypothetical protein